MDIQANDFGPIARSAFALLMVASIYFGYRGAVRNKREKNILRLLLSISQIIIGVGGLFFLIVLRIQGR